MKDYTHIVIDERKDSIIEFLYTPYPIEHVV